MGGVKPLNPTQVCLVIVYCHTYLLILTLIVVYCQLGMVQSNDSMFIVEFGVNNVIIMIIVAPILLWKSGSCYISMIMRSFCHDCHSFLALDQPAIACLFPTCVHWTVTESIIVTSMTPFMSVVFNEVEMTIQARKEACRKLWEARRWNEMKL